MFLTLGIFTTKGTKNNNNNNYNNNNNHHAATAKTLKYVNITSTHIFTPIAIETTGSWNQEAIEIVEDIGNLLPTTQMRPPTYFRESP